MIIFTLSSNSSLIYYSFTTHQWLCPFCYLFVCFNPLRQRRPISQICAAKYSWMGDGPLENCCVTRGYTLRESSFHFSQQVIIISCWMAWGELNPKSFRCAKTWSGRGLHKFYMCCHKCYEFIWKMPCCVQKMIYVKWWRSCYVKNSQEVSILFNISFI